MSAGAFDAAQWRARIDARTNSRDWWMNDVRGLIHDARHEKASAIREEYATYVFTVNEVAERSGILDAETLADFFTEFGRLAANLGEPANDRQVADGLERAIAMQRDNGSDIAGLCLAKAAFLGSRETESAERLDAILTAVDVSPTGSDTWATAIVTLAGYQVEVSRYDDAIATVDRLRTAIPAERYERKFRCASLVHEGMARFTSFQDIDRARDVLTEACAYRDRADDLVIARWVATAYHFLARIAEVDRQFQTAIDLYLVGKQFQDRCPEEVGADAFIHLRIAEPLIAAGALSLAKDHLDEARRLALTGSNISSAWLQVQLGYATLMAADGDVHEAERIAVEALRRARRATFWRGELLCLGYLLVLGVRRRRPDKILIAGLRILRTAFFGELRRNGLLKLLARVPVVVPIAVRRMSRRARTEGELATRCDCPLHDRVASSAESAQRPADPILSR
jgi:tetratricopeptide (TPR) repeat protein